MPDFLRIPNQLQLWSEAVSGWFDESIAYEEANALKDGERCQFYNPLRTDVEGPTFEQAVVWNALPGTLRNRYGRGQALELADHVLPLTQRMDGPGSYLVGGQWETRFYRPQDEYCEWRVTRGPDGRIQRVTFTSEPPEYWQALHGDTLGDIDGVPKYPMVGDRDLLVELYQTYVDPAVRYEDLVCPVDLVDERDPAHPQVVYPKGSYNPYNRWNTTDGVMHLSHPANSLVAEIRLGADATVLRGAARPPLVEPDALICCAAFGGPNRTSDPTIGSSVNQLAALGFRLTLRNPVGLYMHHLDMAGFRTPHGEPIAPEYFRALRGDAASGMIERAVFEVPAEEGFTVSDLRIGEEPITHGAQIAEHITVNLVALAAQPGYHSNTPMPCIARCCQHDDAPDYLSYAELGGSCPPMQTAAFDYYEKTGQLAVAAPAEGARRLRPQVNHRAR
jgi:hypothetical protein